MEQIIIDAMRYRWLKNTNIMRCNHPEDKTRVGDIDTIMSWDSDSSLSSITKEDFDAFVDNAMLFQILNKDYQE